MSTILYEMKTLRHHKKKTQNTTKIYKDIIIAKELHQHCHNYNV